MISIVNDGDFSGGIPFSILKEQGYLISGGKFGDRNKKGVNKKIAVFSRKADHFRISDLYPFGDCTGYIESMPLVLLRIIENRGTGKHPLWSGIKSIFRERRLL